MNIKSFIRYSKGTWVVQRTTYDFMSKKIWNLKSDITIKQILNQKIAIKSYAQNNVDNNYLSLSLIWRQKASSCNVVIYPNDNQLEVCTGKIGELNTACDIYARKVYYFNSHLLNIWFSNASFYICERLWFASDNLALGISIVKCGNHHVLISFESKIRT